MNKLIGSVWFGNCVYFTITSLGSSLITHSLILSTIAVTTAIIMDHIIWRPQ